jgi:hypothetical protein
MTVIYLGDLLARRSFSEAANELSRRIRDAHNFPPLYQVGAVVPSVESAAQALEERGIGPFFIIAGRAARWREKGERRDCTLKLGLAFHQGIQVELLEPVKGSDIHQDSLDPRGKPVVQHLAFMVKDVDAWAEKLEAAGTGLWVRATLKGAGLTADLTYMEKNEDDGLSMEFIRIKLFGIPLRLSASTTHTLGRIQKWTGRRCFEV